MKAYGRTLLLPEHADMPFTHFGYKWPYVHHDKPEFWHVMSKDHWLLVHVERDEFKQWTSLWVKERGP